MDNVNKKTSIELRKMRPMRIVRSRMTQSAIRTVKVH